MPAYGVRLNEGSFDAGILYWVAFQHPRRALSSTEANPVLRGGTLGDRSNGQNGLKFEHGWPLRFKDRRKKPKARRSMDGRRYDRPGPRTDPSGCHGRQ